MYTNCRDRPILSTLKNYITTINNHKTYTKWTQSKFILTSIKHDMLKPERAKPA